MYTYRSAHVKRTGTDVRWRPEDIRGMPAFSIFDNYYGVQITLEHTALDGLVTVNLRDVIDRIRTLPENLTIESWLSGLNGESLPHHAGGVVEKKGTVKFSTSISSGYKAELAFGGGDPRAEGPDSEKHDIMLTKNGVAYNDLYDRLLVTMNGFIHRHDVDVQGLYVKDGGRTWAKKLSNKIGLLDFGDVGKLDFFSIDADMILANPHTGKLIDGAYIELPENIGTRVPLLVIGGYLHTSNSNYYQVGENVIKVDLNAIPLLKRIYESRDEIDISDALDLLETTDRNPSLYSVEQLNSNEFLRSYLSLKNSFVVLVNVDSIYVEKHKLGYTHLHGRYYDGIKPEWPLSLELGRLPEYVAFMDAGVWTLAVQDNLTTRYLFETKGWKKEPLVDATLLAEGSHYYSQGYLLEIGTSQLVSDAE